MDFSPSQNFDLLQPVNLMLRSRAKIVAKTGHQVTIQLYNSYMLVKNKKSLQLPAVSLIKLNFQTQLQKINHPISTSSLCTSSDNKLRYGFKLTNPNGSSIQFLMKARQAKTWVSMLTQQVSQSGFESHYKPLRKIGGGSSCTVYSVTRISDGKEFAVKAISKQFLKKNPINLSNFNSEMQILKSIQHKNLLSFIQVFQTPNNFFVVTQLLQGTNLFHYLLTQPLKLSLESMKKIMRGILEGLDELDKRKIVYKDIKLQNIVLRGGDGLEPVIVDFGLSETCSMRKTKLCGTPGFISPEVLKQQPITPKSDIFSAGVIFHIFLTGFQIFQGQDPKTVYQNNRKMSFDLSYPIYSLLDQSAMDLMRKMLERQAQNRPSAKQCLQHVFLSEKHDQINKDL